MPLVIGRHVAKFLLGRFVHSKFSSNCFSFMKYYSDGYVCRELAWHDVAFFNSDLYEGLRRMLLDVDEGKKSREDFLSTYCCYFEVSKLYIMPFRSLRSRHLWRNRLARSAVNRKVGGSSPPRCVFFSFFYCN